MGQSGENARESEVIRSEPSALHLEKRARGGVSVAGVREAGDHRVVHHGVSDTQRSLVEDGASEGDVAGGGVTGDHGGSGDSVRFGYFVEQVARVSELRRFAVDIDQTVEDVGAWMEPEGDDVGVDGTCEL